MSRVKVDITADKSGFESAVKGVEHNIEGLKEMVVGAFSVEAVKGIVEKTFEYADTIDKASLRMKMTTEQTQALSIVAREAGSSLETVEEAFRKIEAARAKALGGSAKELQAFKALGIDTKELQKTNNTLPLAGKIGSAAGEGSNDKEGVALQNLGLKKTAGDLAVLGESLNNFGEKVDELKARGAIMSDSDIANIVRAKDELEIVGTTLMAQVAPWLSQLIEGIEEGWIIFQTVAENTFAKIMLIADAAIDYIVSLKDNFVNGGKSILAGALTGFAKNGFIGAAVGAATAKDDKGQSIASNTVGFAGKLNTINDEIDSSTQKDLNDRLNGYQKGIADQLAARAKARENKPEADTKAMPVQGKTVKLYSDDLTKSGNLIGASFKGAGSVATALDVSKQQLSEAKKQTENGAAHTELLTQIAENTKPDDDDDDSWP